MVSLVAVLAQLVVLVSEICTGLVVRALGKGPMHKTVMVVVYTRVVVVHKSVVVLGGTGLDVGGTCLVEPMSTELEHLVSKKE